jgi:hypothetical protein
MNMIYLGQVLNVQINTIYKGFDMTQTQRFHYTLTRAYGRGLVSAQQIAELVAIYRGFK